MSATGQQLSKCNYILYINIAENKKCVNKIWLKRNRQIYSIEFLNVSQKSIEINKKHSENKPSLTRFFKPETADVNKKCA